MQLRTKNGYDFFECSSAMQKAIRRNDVKTAGFFALELFHSNYQKYVWKRLLTISAEDCYGLITAEIEALYNAFKLVNEGAKEPKGRIFISKAVILLCKSTKSRDADHLQNLIYDKKHGEIEIKKWLEQVDEALIEKLMNELKDSGMPIPTYAYDVHTRKGKAMGKTKQQFFVEEKDALMPKQISMDDLFIL